jgi:hypothetical protein
MTFAPLPHPHPAPQASSSEPDSHGSAGHRFLHALSYTAAVLLGLTLAPAMVILSDRGTFLHWANYILDVIGSH